MDETEEEIIEEAKSVTQEPLEVKIVQEKKVKEYDNLDHDDEEYIEGYITDEEIKDFDNEK